jgi:murein DD-endopeptidase MepM/ murein hydrolase activator NlpD
MVVKGILNGKPRWPHYGIDIAAKLGTMIKSSGTGVVTMAEDDLYYTGGTGNYGPWSWYFNNIFSP